MIVQKTTVFPAYRETIFEKLQNLEKPGKVICVSPGCVPITQEERKRMEMLENVDAMVSASFICSFESISEHWGKIHENEAAKGNETCDQASFRKIIFCS